jgi:hypothetical protein
MRSAAQQIVHAWHKTQDSLSDELKRALRIGAVTIAAEAIKQLLNADHNLRDVIIEGGIAILIDNRIEATSKTPGRPYQYLTQIQKAENPTIRGVFPLGIT